VQRQTSVLSPLSSKTTGFAVLHHPTTLPHSHYQDQGLTTLLNNSSHPLPVQKFPSSCWPHPQHSNFTSFPRLVILSVSINRTPRSVGSSSSRRWKREQGKLALIQAVTTLYWKSKELWSRRVSPLAEANPRGDVEKMRIMFYVSYSSCLVANA